MEVKEFFELFGTSLSEQKFEIYLNKDFVCCGYVSNISAEIDNIFDAEITRFYSTTSNTIHFDAKIWRGRWRRKPIRFRQWVVHVEIEADSIEEAEQMGYDLDVMAEWNGNSVFSDDAEWNADGTPFDINAELIDGEEENDDEEDNLLF